jgi:hypothetical protein
LRASSGGKLTDGMRGFFDSLKKDLDKTLRGELRDPAAIAKALGFFTALSAATLDRWHSSQAPTILSPQLHAPQ